jgi:hypothetical protein
MKTAQLETIKSDSQGQANELKELAELDLSLVGGGVGDVVFH